LIYGISLAGAAAVSYWRGKRTVSEVAFDTFAWGGAVGTGVNVLAAVIVAEDGTILGFARQNALDNMGTLSKEGIKMLSTINTRQLYRDMVDNGVRVGPVPDNANIIDQDEV
jgi:hypothetical protein